MAETPSSFLLPLGAKAPDFSLLEPKTGKTLALGQLAGPQGTLIVFACNHCPYVIHLGAELGQWSTEAALLGIHTVAINSNDTQAYPADAPELMSDFAQKMGWDFPYLFDESQEVARAYGAACTPDFFLLDANCRLFYAGEFDTSRPQNGLPVTGASLKEALNALLSGEAAPTPFRPAIGCGIKWKPSLES